MKFLIFLIASLSWSTFAAEKFDACKDFVPCGVYEGSGSWYDVNNKKIEGAEYLERLEFNRVSETEVNLKAYFYEGEMGEPWADAIMKFGERGHFTITHLKHGLNYGTGFCANNVCTVAFHPPLVEEDEGQPSFVNSFVNILRFEGNTLKRYNMVSNSSVDEELEFQRSTLTKK